MLPLDWALTHRDALWARAVEQYRSGIDWRKVTEQQRQERIAANLDFQQIDPWGEILGPLLAWQTDGFITLGTIYEKLEVSHRTPEQRQRSDALPNLSRHTGGNTAGGVGADLNLRGFWKAGNP
jgi:predicted P-loop ATPase